MAKIIDPIKLKAAAEHLEWVLRQYPASEDVQALLRALAPIIERAKAGLVGAPIDRIEIPCAYNYADGVYVPYKQPNVGDAYAKFVTEMEGGDSEDDAEILAYIKNRKAEINAGSA